MIEHDILPRLNRLEFRALASYGAVCQYQNLSVAAERLGLAKSAVSEACSAVESVFGLPLFERHTHGMYANEHGQLIAQYALFIQNLEQYAVRVAGQSGTRWVI